MRRPIPRFQRSLIALAPALTLLALAAPAGAQVGTLTTVDGRVVDLTPSASGDLLFCTQGGDAGRISTAGVVTTVSAPGSFPAGLGAIVELPGGSGDLAVIDSWGHIMVLAGGVLPAVQVYTDLYMISDPTDMIVDANGNFVVTSQSPTSGVKAINWVRPDGSSHGYYLVAELPTAIASDPGAGLLLAGAVGGGTLFTIDAGDESHTPVLLDAATQPGFSPSNYDGDIAMEADGSFLFVAGGTVWRHDRGAGTTSQVVSGLGQLRAIAIAPSSGGVPSASGWSAYLAEGEGPTAIRELGDVGAPASAIAGDLGEVPDRGTNLGFFFEVEVYELATDLDGHLLVGGSHWTGNKLIRRVELPSLTQTTVADSAQGIDERIEGIHQDARGTIWAVGHDGKVWKIREDPLQVVLYHDEAQNHIVTAKDLIVDRDSEVYISNRTGFGHGQVVEISTTGAVTNLYTTTGTRGLLADPFTALMYVVEWNCIGFCGTVVRLDPGTGATTQVNGFSGFNLANDDIWGDGDLVADVEGNVYVCTEDDWSVQRFDTKTGKLVRIASGYNNRPSGLAIARSTLPSTTGWSLYVSEFNLLWEIPDVPAPAPHLLDHDAPPVGRLAGYFSPAVGLTRAMVADPAGGGLLISTSSGTIERLDLASGDVTTVAGAAQGLSGDLTAMDVDTAGHLIVASGTGLVWDVDPGNGWQATLVFSNPLGRLVDVRGLAVDGSGQILVIDRPLTLPAGRTWLLSGGVLSSVGHTARGVHPAIDPLTGDYFITEQGLPKDGGGEVLRLDNFSSPPGAGHWRGDQYQLFGVGEREGGIAFDDAGNFYLCAGDDGRIESLDRVSSARATLAGGYNRPRDLVLATGTPGIAGSQGTSLYVLDEWAVFEHGVEGLPAGPPPLAPPGLAPPADLQVAGKLVLGGTTPLAIDSPAEAGLIYLLVPSLAGKSPGLPLAVLGNPTDPRILPINFDSLFQFVNVPGVMDAFVAFLDGSGQSPPVLGLTVPANPALFSLDLFMDFAWMAFEPFSPNGVQKVGGTAQLFLGI